MIVPCDVVLLPSKDLADNAIKASKAVQKYESFFTLEDGKFYPHMSLYMFQLDETDVPSIKDILAKIAANTSPVTVTATNYHLGQGFRVGYVDSEYNVTDNLKDLQNKVVQSINPLRTGMGQGDIAKMQDASGVKLENLQKFGYPAIGELFRPHITLTRLKGHNPDVLNLLPKDVRAFSGLFDRIGLFEIGPNGTCIRKISEFDLVP